MTDKEGFIKIPDILSHCFSCEKEDCENRSDQGVVCIRHSKFPEHLEPVLDSSGNPIPWIDEDDSIIGWTPIERIVEVEDV